MSYISLSVLSRLHIIFQKLFIAQSFLYKSLIWLISFGHKQLLNLFLYMVLIRLFFLQYFSYRLLNPNLLLRSRKNIHRVILIYIIIILTTIIILTILILIIRLVLKNKHRQNILLNLNRSQLEEIVKILNLKVLRRFPALNLK